MDLLSEAQLDKIIDELSAEMASGGKADSPMQESPNVDSSSVAVVDESTSSTAQQTMSTAMSANDVKHLCLQALATLSNLTGQTGSAAAEAIDGNSVTATEDENITIAQNGDETGDETADTTVDPLSQSTLNTTLIVDKQEDDATKNDSSSPVIADDALPEGWASALDGEGSVYYYHRLTRTTQWERPTINSEHKTINLSGALANHVEHSVTSSSNGRKAKIHVSAKNRRTRPVIR
ncbi:unnamed protein product [Sphagnum balticum]